MSIIATTIIIVLAAVIVITCLAYQRGVAAESLLVRTFAMAILRRIRARPPV